MTISKIVVSIVCYRFIASSYWIPTLARQGPRRLGSRFFSCYTAHKLVWGLSRGVDSSHHRGIHYLAQGSAIWLNPIQNLSDLRTLNPLSHSQGSFVAPNPKRGRHLTIAEITSSICMVWCLTHPFICNDFITNLYAWMLCMWLAIFRTRGVAHWHILTIKINVDLYVLLFLLNIAGKLCFLWKYQKATVREVCNG